MMSSIEVVSKSIFALESSRHFSLSPAPQNTVMSRPLAHISSPDDFIFDLYWNNTEFEFDLDKVKALGKAADDDETAFRISIEILVIVAAIFGLIINLFILILTIFHIRGDYRHFIANMAIVDIIGALLFAFMGYINLSDRKRFSVSVMTYSAFAFYGSFGVMICALVPVSLSRVVAAAKPKSYDKLFSGKRSFLVCVISDMAPIILLVIICTSRHDVGRWLFFAYAFLTVSAYIVTFVSNIVVFRIVSKHVRVVRCLHDKARLLETRQVAVATLAQAVVPLICQVPAFLTLSSALLLVEPFLDGRTIVLTQLVLAASPLFDGLITVFVIKQYRHHTIASSILSMLSASATVPPMDVMVAADSVVLIIMITEALSTMYNLVRRPPMNFGQVVTMHGGISTAWSRFCW
uniref:G_PROTEIN_RECEP_F1_2 domain-containing protein n=1 Tax=Panagrellus redivivus TaxID=6233 RepID=A0A7E4UWA7_PANRE